MLLRLRLLVGSLAGSGSLLAILCLGAQNLDQRPQLNLGFGRTAPRPPVSWWGSPWPWG